MIDLSNKKNLYRIYKKKKPNGKFRVIHAPVLELKLEQQILKNRLDSIYNPPDFVSGFIKERNASWALSRHTNKRWICELDIKDFFPSITKEYILGLGLTEYESEIATLNNKLVQGSPCSPILSNLYFNTLDLFFNSYLATKNIDYSRYADNLIISGNEDNFAHAIATIRLNCNSYGFWLPKEKTKLMFQNQEQKVLGITINSKVSINHKVRKKLKNTIKYNGIDKSRTGMLSYINSISSSQANKIKENINNI